MEDVALRADRFANPRVSVITPVGQRTCGLNLILNLFNLFMGLRRSYFKNSAVSDPVAMMGMDDEEWQSSYENRSDFSRTNQVSRRTAAAMR